MEARDTEPRTAARTRRVLVTIVSLLLWGFGTHGTYAGSGDEPHYLAIAHSLAFDRDLDLRNNYGHLEPLLAGGNLVPDLHVREGPDGTLNPVHDVGLPLVFAPFVGIAAPVVTAVARRTPDAVMRAAKLTPATLYRHVVSLGMIALAGVLVALIFDALLRLGATSRAAFWTTLLLMASPPLLAYSTLFFTELASALLAFLVFTRLVLRPAPNTRGWLLTGGVTGFLLLVHVRNAGLVAGLTLLAAIHLRRHGTRRQAAAFSGGLAILLALRTALNFHLWGSWVTTPHAAAGSWEGWLPMLQLAGLRLVGLLVDQEYGLLIYAPVYVLVLAGLPLLARHAPGVVTPLMLVAGCYLALVLLPLSNVHGWTGQWCPAGRFLTPIVPLLGLAVWMAMRAAPRAAVVVVIIQIGLSAYWWQHPRLLWNDGDGRAAFCARVGEAPCARLPSFATWVR